jgi:hypothetical protein
MRRQRSASPLPSHVGRARLDPQAPLSAEGRPDLRESRHPLPAVVREWPAWAWLAETG